MDLVRQRAISKGASQVLGTSHWAKVKGENDNILSHPPSKWHGFKGFGGLKRF